MVLTLLYIHDSVQPVNCELRIENCELVLVSVGYGVEGEDVVGLVDLFAVTGDRFC